MLKEDQRSYVLSILHECANGNPGSLTDTATTDLTKQAKRMLLADLKEIEKQSIVVQD